MTFGSEGLACVRQSDSADEDKLANFCPFGLRLESFPLPSASSFLRPFFCGGSRKSLVQSLAVPLSERTHSGVDNCNG
jgi:hypothetical protein